MALFKTDKGHVSFGEYRMALSQADLVKALVDAGVHFGHRVSRWNPKMEPYIHGKRNMIHIIDVRETVKGLLRAKRLISQTVASGKDILFVGTKRQARHAVEEEARRCGMHYVSERWLGGTLTNFRTIRARLNRLEELEKLWETGQIETYSKKMKSTLGRERDKIKTNLEGIRKMDRMPGVMFIIDTRREHIAVKEAKKLGVKTIALIDTDSDPDLIDLPIPGNDDAMRAIELVVHELSEAVIEGKSGRSDKGAADDSQQPRRRSTRSQFRAGGAEERPAAPGAAPEETQPQIPAPDPSAPEERSPAESVAAQTA
jgi:small subunit ribosomal protein S2